MEDNSLRSRVFQSIRDDILKGKYTEGEELREATLGKELGVSRTPVREALRQLELEGLVEIVPNKGAYVVGISQKDVHDIYVIRSMLEGLCARWAAEHITREQIEELEEIIMLSEFHSKKEHIRQVTEFDSQFHEVLYNACESRILEHVLSDFHKYVQMTRNKSVKEHDRAVRSIEEHRMMLEAIRDKDVELAERLANDHILHVMENLHMEQE